MAGFWREHIQQLQNVSLKTSLIKGKDLSSDLLKNGMTQQY